MLNKERMILKCMLRERRALKQELASAVNDFPIFMKLVNLDDKIQRKIKEVK